jgi:hypothetical protein
VTLTAFGRWAPADRSGDDGDDGLLTQRHSLLIEFRVLLLLVAFLFGLRLSCVLLYTTTYHLLSLSLERAAVQEYCKVLTT